MSDIFQLEKFEDFSEKINIDELYEKKRQHDLGQLALFQKILNRVHVRIRTTSKLNKEERFCWFVVPEVIIGVPKYNQANCIAYIMDKLQENGFAVRYFHPNTILISWNHWVPSYVRTEIKKKTGIEIDQYGKRVVEGEEASSNAATTSATDPMNLSTKASSSKPSRKFTPIDAYKPTGNLVYDEDLLSKLEDKLL